MRGSSMAVRVLLGAALVVVPACDKKSDDGRPSAGRIRTGAGAAERGGTDGERTAERAGARSADPATRPAATERGEPVVPVEGMVVGGSPAAAAEQPRLPSCPMEAMAMEPTQPDPEAGDFTLEEALAGLPGSGALTAVIETSFGTIRCGLASDKVPRAVANFIGLARGVRPWWDGCAKQWIKRPYYDGLMFHRVIPDFMAQGGDPLGLGMGGPGYQFANEIHPELRHDRAGTLAYANSGPDTNGSQFYITVQPKSFLDGGYVVFGYCDSPEIVQRIVSVPRDGNDKPLQPVLMRRITIHRGAS